VALRALCGRPHFEEGFKLWVDTLCIIQADYKEREAQVRKMQNIYGNAWTVIAWLGGEEYEGGKAIDLIKTLSTAGREDCSEELEGKLTEEPSCLDGLPAGTARINAETLLDSTLGHSGDRLGFICSAYSVRGQLCSIDDVLHRNRIFI
jgi:hypothetical protein